MCVDEWQTTLSAVIGWVWEITPYVMNDRESETSMRLDWDKFVCGNSVKAIHRMCTSEKQPAMSVEFWMEVRVTLKRNGWGLAGWLEGASWLVSAILIYSINAVVGVGTTYLQSHITSHGQVCHRSTQLRILRVSKSSPTQIAIQQFSEKSKKV